MIKTKEPLSDIIPVLGNSARVIEKTSATRKGERGRIRYRTGRPLTVETPQSRHICQEFVATQSDIKLLIESFCGYSIHSHRRELSQGFITLRGGHRAGFSGTAVYENGEVSLIRDISSVNIRIAHEHTGCAQELSETVLSKAENFRGLLIIGKPLSAKTTVLRDLCRIIGNRHKLCVIDERGEIAALYNGVPQNDIGANSDVFDSFSKKAGIICALRSMSPEFIACDELGDDSELVCECMNMGVMPILTAHCGSIDELKRSRRLMRIVDSGAVSHTALCENIKGRFSVTARAI